MRSFLSRSFLLLAATTLACDNQSLDFVVGPGTSQTVQASAISLSATAPALTIGQSIQLTAVVQDASGNAISNPTVSWTSSDTRIATVSASGLVAALALGTASITASSGSVAKTATVSVTDVAPTQPGSPAPSVVTLPQLLDTSMPTAPAAGGQVITVGASGDLQAAINAAQPGDVIELAQGATYTGHFTLPNKGAATSWIIIRPASSVQLPAQGVRMSPATAISLRLPKIVTSDDQAALRTLPGANHYRLVGLEVAVATQASNNGLILLGGGDATEGQTALDSVPHDLVLDRMYIHGSSVTSLKRCVALNSAASAVIDSYLSECHAEGYDAQAVAGWNGPGPFKIVNNYLEGSGENVMFGGGDASITGLVPSDIEIRRNHIAKQTSWKGGRWLIKNLLEFKDAQRVLIEGNVFENTWASAQDGSALVLWSANQYGRATWTTCRDVTIRKNIIRNAGAGFIIAAMATYESVPAARISVTDNLMYGINAPGFDGSGRGFLLGGGGASMSDITIENNTVIGQTNTAITFTAQPTLRLAVRNNVLDGGEYGIAGDNTGAGVAALKTFAPSADVTGNVISLNPQFVSAFPTGNSYPASVSAIGFANIASQDYHLSSLSPYKGQNGTRDPGADIDAVMAATQGVIP